MIWVSYIFHHRNHQEGFCLSFFSFFFSFYFSFFFFKRLSLYFLISQTELADLVASVGLLSKTKF